MFYWYLQKCNQSNTVKFRDFPSWINEQNFSEEEKKDKKFAMFCTGGIRCEKASSLMLESFQNVSHLKGGILNYFQKIDKNESMWSGECFVLMTESPSPMI